MKEKIKYVTSGLTFRVIFGTILIIFLFEFMVSAVGYRQFTESLTQEYQDAAFRTANTATALIDADKIESYLNWGENDPEYRNILSYLDILCQKQGATFVYVISVDTSDYNHFRSVFNVVNANGSDTPWPVGYERETTNEEYRTLYRDLYEGRRTQGFITRTNALNGREPHTTALLPLQGSNGNVKGILCVERPMSELTATRTAYLRGVICIIMRFVHSQHLLFLSA